LEAEHAKLSAEHAELVSKLAFTTSPNERRQPATTMEKAQMLLSGGTLPTDNVLTDMQARELELRQRIELLGQALREAPAAVERQRDKARAEALQDHKDRAKVQQAWDKAVEALRGAVSLEDALIADTVAGGFGSSEPSITAAPTWLNRDVLKLAA